MNSEAKNVFLVILSAFFAFPVIADEWQTYRNQKYGYQIQYPENCELRVTGIEAERDGRAFLVVLREISSLHGIHGTVHPGLSLAELAEKESAPAWEDLESGPVIQVTNTHKISWSKTSLNGIAVLLAEIRASETDELLSARMLMNNVEFSVQPWGEFDHKVAEQIVSTFKFDD